MAHYPHQKSLRDPEASGDVVGRTLQAAGLGHQLWRLDIFRRWPEAVGAKIAARTQPQTFSRGTLVVRAASATWQNELMFLRQTIITRLNGMLDAPRIKELKVISGHLPQPAAAVPHAPVAPSEGARTAAQVCATPIVDHDVREAFAAFMAQTLEHQRRHNL